MPSLKEISNLSLENEATFVTILARLVDFSQVQTGNVPYAIRDGITPILSRLVLDSALTAPTLGQMQAELVTYKAELAAVEQARLNALVAASSAEEARIATLRTRFEALEDPYLAMKEEGTPEANPAMLLKRIIEDDEQALMTSLETKHAAAKLIEDAKYLEAQAITRGQKSRQLGLATLDLILDINSSKPLTDAQTDALFASYGTIVTLLQSGSVKRAKSLIEATTPDGTLMVQADKDKILTFLGRYLP